MSTGNVKVLLEVGFDPVPLLAAEADQVTPVCALLSHESQVLASDE